MTSLTLEDEVLKTDRRGRVRVPRARREALLAEFARSGVSAAEFARLAGLKCATFVGWVARQKKGRAVAEEQAGPQPSAPLRLASVPPGGPVRLWEALVETAPRAGQPLPVELPGGARLLLAEPAQVPLAVELLVAVARKGGRPC